MNETQADKAPLGLENYQPEEGTRRMQLWGTSGKSSSVDDSTGKYTNRVWIHIYASKEEAEADSVRDDFTHWVWDGKPAEVTTLGVVMDRARRKGALGVKVTGYRNGQWVTLHKYPVDVPLPE